MLGNINRKLKKNILEQFRQEAINYRERKKYEKLKRIQEEKDFLLKQEKLFNNDKERINKEKHRKKEQEFNEYNLMLSKLHSKTPVYRIKNSSSTLNTNNKRPVIKFNIKELDKNKNLFRRERDIILRRDIIGKYLTDENNTEELFKDLRREKEKSQKYYKEINDLQFSEYQKNNMKRFGTIDPLIVRRAKRKLLTENPFSHKIKYDYWKSNLSNNPILNPENNVHYNKYLFQENFDCEKNDNNNDNNNNDNNKNNINNNINSNDNIKNMHSIDIDYRPKNIKLIKTNKVNHGIINAFIKKSNINDYNSSGYELELKKKFFNINNEFYRRNKYNNDYKEDIHYNNFSYGPNLNKRRVLRQAISSSFLH